MTAPVPIVRRQFRTSLTRWPVALLVTAVACLGCGRSHAASPEDAGGRPSPAARPAQQPMFRLAADTAEQGPRPGSNDRRDTHGGGKLLLRVVGVHDGDTITGLDASKTQHKIRLDAIDAPELGQPFGQAAKKALSDMVFGKDVTVTVKSHDRYGRTIGHVLVDGRDVNLELLEEGMAWHYTHFDHNARLSRAEQEARAAKKGLWRDAAPVPPWDWRKDRHRRTAGAAP